MAHFHCSLAKFLASASAGKVVLNNSLKLNPVDEFEVCSAVTTVKMLLACVDSSENRAKSKTLEHQIH